MNGRNRCNEKLEKKLVLVENGVVEYRIVGNDPFLLLKRMSSYINRKYGR